MAEQVKRDYRRARLTPRQKALCEFAEKVTRAPADVERADLDGLRAQGLADRDVLDAVEIISYFNYINRIADALGTDPEPEMKEAHERWQKQRRASDSR